MCWSWDISSLEHQGYFLSDTEMRLSHKRNMNAALHHFLCNCSHIGNKDAPSTFMVTRLFGDLEVTQQRMHVSLAVLWDASTLDNSTIMPFGGIKKPNSIMIQRVIIGYFVGHRVFSCAVEATNTPIKYFNDQRSVDEPLLQTIFPQGFNNFLHKYLWYVSTARQKKTCFCTE